MLAVGRHSADGRPVVAPSTRASKPASGGLAGTLTAGAALALVGATLLGVSAAGVPIMGRGPSDVAPTPAPASPRPVAAITQTPAHQSFATLLNESPNSAWQPVGEIAWTAGTPFDESCGRPGALGPSVAGSRVYQTAGGQVMVSLMAYSAGLGAGAFQDWQHQLSSCGSVSSYTVPGPAAASTNPVTPTDALVVWGANVKGAPTSSMMWRRGDVLTWISAPQSMNGSLGTKSLQFDQLLLPGIAHSCASVDSVLADAARNPWLAPKDFTGLITQVPVAVSHAPWPTLPPGSTPVPHTYVPSPVPSVSYPSRPADPVWPLELPTPVTTPEMPVVPTLPPSATAVPSRAPDPIGPGCGWAFTGQVPPTYDEVQQAALAQGLADKARAALLTAQSQWQTSTLAYWQQVPTYAAQLQEFLAYAAAVRDVALLWDSISSAREAYDTAVRQYNEALAAQQAFTAQQQQAQAAYDAALTACANAPGYPPTPTATYSPPPTQTPGPTDTTGPNPTGTTTATASPSGPSPTPSPTGPAGCPPVRPAILDQPIPTLPPVPVPPPDPHPPVSASPTG